MALIYELLTPEKGYRINGDAVLYQPEPYIPYRVMCKDNTTDYAASAEAHIKVLEQQEQAAIPNEVSMLKNEAAELKVQLQQTEIQLTDIEITVLELQERIGE